MRDQSGQHRTIGTAGLIAGVWLLVGNLTHPIGSTEQYINGEVFVDSSTVTTSKRWNA